MHTHIPILTFTMHLVPQFPHEQTVFSAVQVETNRTQSQTDVHLSRSLRQWHIRQSLSKLLLLNIGDNTQPISIYMRPGNITWRGNGVFLSRNLESSLFTHPSEWKVIMKTNLSYIFILTHDWMATSSWNSNMTTLLQKNFIELKDN